MYHEIKLGKIDGRRCALNSPHSVNRIAGFQLNRQPAEPVGGLRQRLECLLIFSGGAQKDGFAVSDFTKQDIPYQLVGKLRFANPFILLFPQQHIAADRTVKPAAKMSMRR